MATEPSTELGPMLAVRTALGLSVQDAADILNTSTTNVLDLDGQPIEALKVLAAEINKEGGEVILKIMNPDDSTFKEWTVTPEGYLYGTPQASQSEASPDEPEAHPS